MTDAKAWAKEQVRLMNEAEKEDYAKFNIELCAGTDLVMDEQRRFNGGYLFFKIFIMNLDCIKYAVQSLPDILLSMILTTYSHALFIHGFFILPQKEAVSMNLKDS